MTIEEQFIEMLNRDLMKLPCCPVDIKIFWVGDDKFMNVYFDESPFKASLNLTPYRIEEFVKFPEVYDLFLEFMFLEFAKVFQSVKKIE